MGDSTKTETQLMKELEALRRQIEESGCADPAAFAEGSPCLEIAARLEREIRERRRLEEALRASEDRLRAFSDVVLNYAYACRIEADGGFVREWRVGDYSSIIGYSPEEVDAMEGGIQSIVHPEDLPIHMRRKQRLQCGEPDTSEYRIITKSGQVRWIRAYGKPVWDNTAGRVVRYYAAAQDITERKRAEERLRETKNTLDNILNSATEYAIVATDLEFRILHFNPAAERLYGCEAERAAGRGYEVLHNRAAIDRDQFDRELKELDRTGKYEYDIEQRTPNGDERVIHATIMPMRDEKGQRTGYVHFGTDITERRRAEQAAREHERALSTLMSNLPGMAYRCRNDREWTMEFVSDGCAALTGYQPNELRGNRVVSYADLILEEDRESVWNDVQAALQEREPFQLSYRITAANGSEKWVWEMGRGVFSPTGELLALEGFITDVTERIRAEEAQRKLEAQLQHAQKLESMGVLAGGIAHDFNNLLVGILGNIDLAIDDVPPDSPALKSLRGVETAAKRAADLTRQMLAYSGKGRFVVEALDLNQVVREMTGLLEVSISKKAIIKYDFAANLPRIEADGAQIRQVVMNLITNASDAIGGEPGVISISTSSTYCDQDYLRKSRIDYDLPAGRYVCLEVSDTGCGMDAETQRLIFDPFFTTKFTGRGLGLAAVQGIIRGHSGALVLYSEPGRGATFKVLLPALFEPAAQPTGLPVVREDWRREGTILLVDDDEIVREVAARMLETAGFDVVTAAGGPEALSIFKSRANEITCVVLDMTMPEMDGDEVLRELRRIRKDACVVMSSGYNEQEVIRRFAGRDHGGFVQKPYERAQLLQAVQKAIENRPIGFTPPR